MTKASKQRKYYEISQERKLGKKGMSARVLHLVERQLKRAPEPKKTVDQ